MKRAKPIIEHPLLEPFEPQLKAFLEWAFDGGIRSLEAAGYKLGDDLVDVKAGECFKNGLFFSFAQTQSAVGLLFIELENKRRQLSEEIRRFRSHVNPALENTQEQLEAVENRQLILRRLMDGILWILLSKPWIANRLVFKKHVSRPDPDQLMKLLAIASGLNQEAKREIHLVSDLTTISQIGDIIRIRWDEDGVYLRLNEIKSGPMNDKLSDLIESRGGILSEEDLQEVETQLGCAAKAQAYRMIRQRERFRQFEANFQSEPLQTGPHEDKLQQALTKARAPSMRTYLLDLPELVDGAKDPSNSFGMNFLGIDGCLWLVALSEKGLAKLGELRNLHHWLFHIKHPELTCQVGEIEALNREYPLINLAAHNMTYVMSRSPLIWYPKDLVLDIVMDRVTIYAQFDLDAFFKIAAKANLKLSLIMGKEAEEGKRTKASTPMLENPKSYGVKVKFSNGREFKLRSSFFRSVYSGLVPPTEILRIITTLDEVQGRVNP